MRIPPAPRPERELDEELRFHMERTVEELVAEGMAEGEARKEASRRFGDVDRHRRHIARIDRGRRRKMKGRQGIETAVQHLGQAVRGMARSPGFAVAVVVTLALGIGVNATVFGLVDRLLLSAPPGIEDPDRVVQLHVERVSPFSGYRQVSGAFTWPDYTDLVELPEFGSVAAFSGQTQTLGRGAGAETVQVEMATASYFPLLGVQSRLGRFFAAEEDRIDALGDPPAVLSHAFWVRRFAADPDVLGAELDLGPGRYTVVGVAPEGFTGASLDPVDVWLPLLPAQVLASGGTAWEDARGWYWLSAVARLAPGVSREEAVAAATRRHHDGRRELIDAGRYDGESRVVLGSLVPAEGPNPGREVAVTRWLAGVAILVLLVACANVANLLLVRSVRRRRELAVRLALGMSRGRLAAHLLSESVLLAGVAGVGALAAAGWAGRLLHRTLLQNVNAEIPFVEGRTVLFTLGVTGGAALLAGVLPALRGSRVDLQDDLRSGARAGGARSPLRSALLVLQAGLSVVLLVGAGLFVRSLDEARSTEVGYDPDAVLMATVVMENGGMWGAAASEAGQQAAERLRALPGLRVATSGLAPQMGLWGVTVDVPGRDSVPIEGGGPFYYPVSEEYLAVLGTTVQRGRDLAPSDYGSGAEPVTLVTSRLAELVWGTDDVIGECVLVNARPDEEPPPCTRVVGVTADQRVSGIEDEWVPALILPSTHPVAMAQTGGSYTAANIILVRDLDGDASDRVAEVRKTILAAVPGVRFANVRTYRDVLDPQARPWRLGATLFSLFGALALGVSAVGLYSLVAFQVAERRRELGIRAALGGTVGHLVGLVGRQALALTAAGLVLGTAVALLAGRALSGVLFGVSPTEPGVYLGVAALMLLVAGAAAAIPSLKAGRLDPAAVLRSE